MRWAVLQREPHLCSHTSNPIDSHPCPLPRGFHLTRSSIPHSSQQEMQPSKDIEQPSHWYPSVDFHPTGRYQAFLLLPASFTKDSAQPTSIELPSDSPHPSRKTPPNRPVLSNPLALFPHRLPRGVSIRRTDIKEGSQPQVGCTVCLGGEVPASEIR